MLLLLLLLLLLIMFGTEDYSFIFYCKVDIWRFIMLIHHSDYHYYCYDYYYYILLLFSVSIKYAQCERI